MDRRILQTIPDVRFVGVEDNEALSVEDSKPLSWFVVVLVDFRQSLRKVIVTVIDRMVERDFHELAVWKDPRDLAAEALIHSVVVVGEEGILPREDTVADAQLPSRRIGYCRDHSCTGTGN